VKPSALTFLAIGVSATAILFISPSMPAVNYFDPPKRLAWACICLLLGFSSLFLRDNRSKVMILGVLLLIWMIARTLIRESPFTESGVLLSWCLPLMLFLVGLGIRREHDLTTFCRILFLGGLLQAGFMLAQRAGFDPLFGETTQGITYRPARMIGTIGFQNQAVHYLGIVSATTLIAFRGAWMRGGMLLVMLTVIAFSGARGGILAISAAIIGVTTIAIWSHASWISQRKIQFTVMMAMFACVAAGLVMAIPETQERFHHAFQEAGKHPSIGSRITMWRVAWKMLLESPWAGWGAGEYAFQYLNRLGEVHPPQMSHQTLQSTVYAREAHNDYLQFAVEFGWIGILFLFLIILTGTRLTIQEWKHAPDRSRVVLFVTIYMAVAAFISFPWQTSMAGPFAGLMLGIFWPHPLDHSPNTAQPAHAQPTWRSVLHGSLLVCGGTALVWCSLDAYLNIKIPGLLAEKKYDKAELSVPAFTHRYLALVGAVYAANGRDEDAESVLRNAQSGYQDVLLWNNLGLVFSNQGKWEQALDIYRSWMRSGLEHKIALANVAAVSEKLGLYDEAARALGRQIDLWPTGSLSEIRRLALLRYKHGDATAALDLLLLHSAIWQDGDPLAEAKMYNLIGVLYLELNQRDQALQNFHRALLLFPELNSARHNLKRLGSDPKGYYGLPPSSDP